MSEDSYEEENLDVFMLKAADVFSQESSKEKMDLLESLKQHLSSIFENKGEMENFFKTLNSVIFSEDLKLRNKQVFILYPIIYSFNPKLLINYFYFFLDTLQICVTDENKNDFTFLNKIFSEVIQSFFNPENENVIKKSYLLDKKGKNIAFEKIMNFCEDNIKTNKRLEQSFGCLILTEFIEKCPLIKDQNYLDIIFKKISDYLDDRWFECKLDLLNCVLNLIHTQGKKFKLYANVCLFKILDFFTDEDWMKRKIAVNIVYSLTFYCKEEILNVKDNIIDFLSVLKNDPNDKVKEICIKTLNYIDECDSDNGKNDKDDLDEINNIEEKLSDINLKNINIDNGMNDINKIIDDKEQGKGKGNIQIINANNKNKKLININIKDDIKEKENKKLSEIKSTKDEHLVLENEKNNDENNNINIPKITITNKTLNDKYGNTLDNILSQMQKIQETQKLLNSYLENMKTTIDQNYSNLSERLKILENYSEKKNFKY